MLLQYEREGGGGDTCFTPLPIQNSVITEILLKRSSDIDNSKDTGLLETLYLVSATKFGKIILNLKNLKFMVNLT